MTDLGSSQEVSIGGYRLFVTLPRPFEHELYSIFNKSGTFFFTCMRPKHPLLMLYGLEEKVSNGTCITTQSKDCLPSMTTLISWDPYIRP
jgi:hypothetical protein